MFTLDYIFIHLSSSREPAGPQCRKTLIEVSARLHHTHTVHDDNHDNDNDNYINYTQTSHEYSLCSSIVSLVNTLEDFTVVVVVDNINIMGVSIL